MIEKIIALVVVGIIVGLTNSVAGGGILIGFPLLLTFGITPLVANATSNIIVLSGQITSSFGYHKYLRKIPRPYYLLLIPTVLGAVIGAYVLRKTPNTNFELIAPLLILLAVVMFAFQPYIRQRIYRVPDMVARNHHPTIWTHIVVFGLSIYGGYFGAGYGLIMLAILSFTKLKNIHEMNGLKNVCAIGIAGTATLVLSRSNLINWRYGLVMAAGTAVGGYIGARFAPRLPMTFIRVIVVVIGIATAIYLTSQVHLA